MEGSMTSVDIDIVEFKNADGHKIGQNMWTTNCSFHVKNIVVAWLQTSESMSEVYTYRKAQQWKWLNVDIILILQ
jgi:hypothetical protein